MTQYKRPLVSDIWRKKMDNCILSEEDNLELNIWLEEMKEDFGDDDENY